MVFVLTSKMNKNIKVYAYMFSASLGFKYAYHSTPFVFTGEDD